MKQLFALIIGATLTTTYVNAQSTKDTASTPYWIDMMADPSINFYKTQRAFNLYWENRTVEKGSGYKPFKRWEYNMSQLIDGQGNIPVPGFYESEVERYLQLRGTSFGPGGVVIGGVPGNGSATCNTDGDWKEIGPYTMPSNRTGQPNGLGRINGLAFHPTDSNIIYAGAPAGGVWVSEDGGKTWSTNTDSLATLGVSSIAVDPVHPDTIYLGTGDRDANDSYGRGIFRSTDGGQTWKQSTTGLGNATIARVIIDPSDHHTLLVASTTGIYRSTDAGNSWTRTSTGSYKDIAFDAANSNYVYASRTSARFYRSTDNGASWSQVTTGLPTGKSRMGIAVTPDDSNFVYAIVTNQRSFAGLYLSTNRGQSFTLMSDKPNIMDYSHLGSGTGGQAWYDLDIAVHPDDKTIVTVCGVNVFQSIDSGKTWKINAHWVGSGGAPAVHADHHIMEYQPGTQTLYSGNDGGVHFTKDLGKTWTEISEGIGIAQIYRIGQSATHPNHLINGYQDNGTGLLENGNWNTVVGGDGMDCVIDPSDVNYAYSDLYYGDVRRMVNGYYNGKIAAENRNGITERGGWVTPFVLREGTPGTMFIGYKNIWRSTNIKAASAANVTWTKISNNVAGSNSQNITALENSPANSNVLYVSRAGNKFFKSTNVNAGTPTWTDLTAKLPNNASVLFIESHSKMANRVWICQSNKVYQSDDGGNTWTNISNGLPNIPMLSLVHDTSSKKGGIYVGSYMGVFYKDTTMSAWEWFNDNMPIHTRVRDIEIFYSPKGRDFSHVVCGTYGRGNWRSPLYDEDQQTPVPDFRIESPQACMGEAIRFTDSSTNLPTMWYWSFSPNTVTYANGTDSCSQHPEVIFNATGKYTVKLIAENCAGYDSLEIVDGVEIFQPIRSATCQPKTQFPQFGTGVGIFDLSVDRYSFSSGDARSEGEYIDQACTKVLYLKSDTFYLTQVTNGLTYNEYVRIYIDFNDNGNLEDAGELVFDESGSKIHNDTIKIPVNAKANTLLRMRVMSDRSAIQHSCDTLRYGQTEDYGVVLEPRIPVPHFVVDTNRICQNEFVTLTDSSQGSIYKWRWYLGNYSLKTYKSDSAGPVTYNLPDTGWYYAELVLNDSIVSKRVDSLVYVAPKPTAALTVIGGSINACEGESIRLKNTTDQKSGDFAWFKDNVKMGILDDSIITLGNVFLADSGTYFSTITHLGCQTISNSVTVKVNANPTADFDISNLDSCLATNTLSTLNNTSISAGTLTHSWNFGDGSTSNGTTPSHSYSDTGSYTIELAVLSDKNCSDTIRKSLNIWSSPNADFSINASPQCFTNNNFSFTNGSSINAGGLTYFWDLGNGKTASALNAGERYTSIDTFDVQLIAVSDKNCADTTVKEAITSPNPVADFRIDVIDSCFNNNAFDFVNQSTISSGTIFSNNWDFGNGNSSSAQDSLNYSYSAATTHNVVLIVESAAGCSDTLEKTVAIHPSPTADFSIDDSLQCFNGHTFNFGNTSNMNSGTVQTVLWDFGDNNTSSGNNPAHSYAAPGTYTVTLSITSDQNCMSDLLKPVTVHPSPEVAFTGGITCEDELLNFVNTSSIASGSLADFEWTFGDGNTSQLSDPSNTYSNAGIYEVKLIVTSDQGCKDSLIDKTAATVNAKPDADFSYATVSSFDAQTEVEFTSLTANASSFTWWINNAIQGNASTINHVFQDTGTFMVALHVGNSDGCNDTIEKPVFVVPDAVLRVPTSFSPNGDLLNDVFKPLGVRFVREYEVEIFNRWGQQVYASNDPSQGWDGSFNGAPAPTGQYLVTVVVIDFNNERVKYNGLLSLIR